jgi:eukaryotic-like serine/threonine-protein kinase
VKPATGLTVGDRYTLAERIAVGGVGEVWRARDAVLHRDVAVKVLKEEYAADPSFLERFRDEARHTAGLAHPGVANVFDYGEVDGTAYLVMELVDGEPLSALIARSAPLPVDRALRIVGQAALALQAAHDTGLIHRDVKPGNLLLADDDTVKVTDFGIARAVGAETITDTGLVVGTAAYLSPEQATGRPVTPSSDVYALGVVAYECLAGRRPFVADSPMGVALAHATSQPDPLPSTVPPLVADFVMRALDKDPARRQGGAGDFGRTALALAAQLGETAEPPEPQVSAPPRTALLPVAEAIGRDPRRARAVAVAAGVVLVLLGFLALRACDGDDRPDGPQRAGSATPGATEPGPQTVRIRAANYLGLPGEQVRRTLEDRGLRVRLTSAVSTAPAGTVTAIEPTGSLREGTTVTVTTAVAPPPPGKEPKKKKPHGHDD